MDASKCREEPLATSKTYTEQRETPENSSDQAPVEVTKERSHLQELGMFANLLTMARIVLTPVFVWAFLSESWILRVISLAVFVFAAITDWWDGHHARKSQSVTRVGRFLDPLADKLLTISAMLTFAWAFESVLMLVMVIIIFARDFLLTWLRARAEKHGHPFTTLWFAKMKTSVQLTAIITIIAVWTIYTIMQRFNVFPDIVSQHILVAIFNLLIGVTAVLAIISAGQYLKRIASGEQLI